MMDLFFVVLCVGLFPPSKATDPFFTTGTVTSDITSSWSDQSVTDDDWCTSIANFEGDSCVVLINFGAAYNLDSSMDVIWHPHGDFDSAASTFEFFDIYTSTWKQRSFNYFPFSGDCTEIGVITADVNETTNQLRVTLQFSTSYSGGGITEVATQGVKVPTEAPTNAPSSSPTLAPSIAPTSTPTAQTQEPSNFPTNLPTDISLAPSSMPTQVPIAATSEFESTAMSTQMPADGSDVSINDLTTTDVTANTGAGVDEDGTLQTTCRSAFVMVMLCVLVVFEFIL